MRPADNINQLIKKLQLKASANLDKRVHEKISNAQVRFKNKQSAHIQPFLWSKIMKSNITKLAAAAVIIIAVLVIGLPFGNSGVAWGALIEKIENVNVVFRLTTNVKMQDMPQEQIPKTETIAYYSSEYGTRVDQYIDDKLSFTMYLNPKENIFVTVMPEQKMFTKVIDKSPDELKQIAEKDDPRVMVRNLLSTEYKHLGRDTIDGIDVEGIECTGPGVMSGMFENATARLWVEIGTDFPVHIEIEGIVSGGQMEMRMVMDNFQWNAELNPALFVPDIPSDYTSQEMKVEANEDSAINGLRVFAELTGGRYPSSLVYMTFMKEISEELTKKYVTEIAEKQDDSTSTLANMLKGLTENQGEFTSTITDALQAAVFYTQLVAEGKDVVYYGDTVTAENPEAVLLRWKVSEGVYRAVFGDLSAGNVSAEELAKLEK